MVLIALTLFLVQATQMTITEFSTDQSNLPLTYPVGENHLAHPDDNVNFTADFGVLIPAAPNLRLSKTVTPTTAVAGDTLTYTIVYTSDGDAPVSGLHLTDTVPLSITITDIMIRSTDDTTIEVRNNHTLILTRTAPFLGTGVFTIVGQLDQTPWPSTPLNLTNQVTGTYDLNPPPIITAAVLRASSGPPANIALTAVPTTTVAGNPVAITTTLTDQYGNPVLDGQYVTFMSSSPNTMISSSSSTSNGQAASTLRTISPAATVTTVTAQCGVISTTTRVTFLQEGFTLSKSSAPNPVQSDGVLVYTIQLANISSDILNHIVITDFLSFESRTQFVASDPPSVDVAGNRVFTLSSLAPFSVQTAVITVQLTGANDGETLTNIVRAKADGTMEQQASVNTTVGEPQVSSIGDFVWLDSNSDGIQDAGESGLPGVMVNLWDGADTAVLSTTRTNNSGYYDFATLTPGDYLVEFILPPNFMFSPQDQGADDSLDNDANVATGKTIATTLAPGENDFTWDAGMMTSVALVALGDYVWLDSDADGIQDAGEAGVNDVTVNLWYDTNVDNVPDTILVSTVTTNNGAQDGYYAFANLIPYTAYQIEFVLPTGYSFTLSDQGADDMVDSDVDTMTGLTAIITPGEGEHNSHVDAGIYRPALEVAQTVSAAVVAPNQIVTYALTITNTGSVVLNPVKVVIVIGASRVHPTIT